MSHRVYFSKVLCLIDETFQVVVIYRFIVLQLYSVYDSYILQSVCTSPCPHLFSSSPWAPGLYPQTHITDACLWPKRTPGRTLTMHRPGSDRGEDDNRRDPGGPGRGTAYAGPAHRLPGKGDRSDSPGPGDGDGGPRTRTAGAVPSPRNSGG